MAFSLINDDATGNWSSNTFSYSFPSGAPAAGQLDVIGINMFSGTLVTPAGWTLDRQTATTGGGTCNQYLIHKVAGSSDPSSVLLANTISGGGAVLCWARYSAAGAITADATGGGTPTATNNSNAASAPAVSLPIAGSGELAVAYAGGFNGSGISGLTWGGGFTAAASGTDGFSGVSDALGHDLSASGTQAPTLSWTSGNLGAQFMMAQAFIEAAAGQTVNGAVSALALASPAGSVTADGTVAGVLAGLALAAPAGAAQSNAVVVSGPVAQLLLSATAGSPFAPNPHAALPQGDSDRSGLLRKPWLW